MPDFQMVYVAPADLAFAEDAVREGLEILKRKTKSAKWQPDDILAHIRTKRADLYLVYLDGEYGGFVVLSETAEAFTLERRLLVWCAVTARVANSKGRPVVHPRHKEIRKLADEGVNSIAKARGIEIQYFVSSRRGWQSAAPEGRWAPYETTYTRETK